MVGFGVGRRVRLEGGSLCCVVRSGATKLEMRGSQFLHGLLGERVGLEGEGLVVNLIGCFELIHVGSKDEFSIWNLDFFNRCILFLRIINIVSG